jgi:DNA-binding response OmpR family regulator
MASPARTVMIVDDEPDILDMVDILLDSGGYKTLRADSGQVAMDMLDSHSPDLMLLDIMMPDVDGHAVCTYARAKQTLANMPIFMLTAKNDVANIGRALEAGANGFIVKPFDTEDLLRVIAAKLGGTQTAFYKSPGNTVPVDARALAREASGAEQFACVTVSEPPAPFSTVIQACEDQHFNLLSLWQRDERDRQITTALLSISSSEHFGDLLNRILSTDDVDVLHCCIYRELSDVPIHKMEGR